MKNTNKKVLITSLLGIASLATIGSTFAFNGKSQNKSQLDETTRNAIHEAVLNNDYTTFQTLTATRDHQPEISEKKFEEMSQRVINNKDSREQRKADREAKRTEMMKIMDNADYSAWKEIAPDDMVKIIDTEDKFQQLVQMHKYMESARKIREELGLPEDHMQNMGNMGNMENRQNMWMRKMRRGNTHNQK